MTFDDAIKQVKDTYIHSDELILSIIDPLREMYAKPVIVTQEQYDELTDTQTTWLESKTIEEAIVQHAKNQVTWDLTEEYGYSFGIDLEDAMHLMFHPELLEVEE